MYCLSVKATTEYTIRKDSFDALFTMHIDSRWMIHLREKRCKTISSNKLDYIIMYAYMYYPTTRQRFYFSKVIDLLRKIISDVEGVILWKGYNFAMYESCKCLCI